MNPAKINPINAHPIAARAHMGRSDAVSRSWPLCTGAKNRWNLHGNFVDPAKNTLNTSADLMKSRRDLVKSRPAFVMANLHRVKSWPYLVTVEPDFVKASSPKVEEATKGGHKCKGLGPSTTVAFGLMRSFN